MQDEIVRQFIIHCPFAYFQFYSTAMFSEFTTGSQVSRQWIHAAKWTCLFAKHTDKIQQQYSKLCKQKTGCRRWFRRNDDDDDEEEETDSILRDFSQRLKEHKLAVWNDGLVHINLAVCNDGLVQFKQLTPTQNALTIQLTAMQQIFRNWSTDLFRH